MVAAAAPPGASSSFPNLNSAFFSVSSLPGINNLSSAQSLSGLAGISQTNASSAFSTLTGTNSNPASGGGSASANSGNSKRLTGGVSTIESTRLERGPLLISPSTNTVVQTDFGSVAVAAKSVVLILAFDGGIAVYNLHDSHKNAVVLSCGNHSRALAPGQNAVMTSRDVRFFEEINPAQSVSYRRMRATKFDDGVSSFCSEFNVLSMLHGYEPLKQLVRSAEPEKRKMSQSMLKTAAILAAVGSGEPFEYMVARPITALNAQGANSY